MRTHKNKAHRTVRTESTRRSAAQRVAGNWGASKTTRQFRRVIFPCVRTTHQHPRGTLRSRTSSTPFGLAFGSPPSKKPRLRNDPPTSAGHFGHGKTASGSWPLPSVASPKRTRTTWPVMAVPCPPQLGRGRSLNLEPSIRERSKMGEEPSHRGGWAHGQSSNVSPFGRGRGGLGMAVSRFPEPGARGKEHRWHRMRGTRPTASPTGVSSVTAHGLPPPESVAIRACRLPPHTPSHRERPKKKTTFQV